MYFLIVVKFICGVAIKTIDINLVNIIVFCTFCFFVMLGCVGLLWNTVWNKSRLETIKITNCQNITDQHFLTYFSLFVLFALAFELTKLSMFIVSLFIILFIGIVYVNNKMFYINPTLNILGFNFYEITYTHNQKEQTAKMFYKGTLSNGTYKANLKNKHFNFITKKVA